MHELSMRSEDYGLILAALFVARNSKTFTRAQRERLNKLSQHFRQLAADALGKEQVRGEEREKVIERRTARQLPSVSGEETDDWHRFLTTQQDY